MSMEAMREELIDLVSKIKESGANLVASPALFRWTYEEHPDIEYQMLIKGIEVEKKEEKPQIILPDQSIIH